MKLLVIGSGGREHALAWKLKQSPLAQEIFLTPGNGGTSSYRRPPEEVQGLDQLARWAQQEEIHLTVVGPEMPLVEGITDTFQQKGLRVFGPTKAGAVLEGSKIFAKELMVRHGIPTGDFHVCHHHQEAFSYLEKIQGPVVVKADGLAAGKGVFVAQTPTQAREAVQKMMVDGIFGDAGRRILLEEYLEGEEASILAITNGEEIIPLAPSQDHKRIFDGDEGDNTGGMGAFSPTPLLNEALQQEVEEKILRPTLKALQEEGISYQGVLYAGLMITAAGPQVLEFNCRFGDPETQVILPRMEGDLLPILLAAAEGLPLPEKIDWDPRVALCVVMASGGYPKEYKTGYPIHGLDRIQTSEELLIFHAGTLQQEGVLKTAGGRVLGVVAKGQDFVSAKERAYRTVQTIEFAHRFYRQDIGDKAILYEGEKR